jgi:hypothetical protein
MAKLLTNLAQNSRLRTHTRVLPKGLQKDFEFQRLNQTSTTGATMGMLKPILAFACKWKSCVSAYVLWSKD